MLKIIFTGRLGADAQVRDAGASKVIAFNIAHSEKIKDRTGSTIERTQWVSCSYFREAGKTGVADYLKKGTQVLIEGTPSAESYINGSGQNVVVMKCNVHQLELLGSPSNNNSQTQVAQTPQTSYSPASDNLEPPF